MLSFLAGLRFKAIRWNLTKSENNALGLGLPRAWRARACASRVPSAILKFAHAYFEATDQVSCKHLIDSNWFQSNRLRG